MAWRKPANLNEWFGIILRHKKKFFYPTVVVMIGFIFSSQWWPREYSAEAKFQRRSDFNSNAGSGTSALGDAYGRIRALMHYNFKGRPAIEQLITDLSLTKGFGRSVDGELTSDGKIQYNDLINRLTNSINIGTQVASEQIDLLSVSFTDTDRTLVPQVCNQLVENYIRKVRTEMDDTLLEQKKFFDQEVARYRRKVSDLEGARLRFTINQGGVNPDDPMVIYNKLAEVKGDRERRKAELDKAKASLEALIKWETEEPDFVQNRKTTENEELMALKETLKALQAALDENLFGFRRTEAHPAVKDLLRRIADKKKELAEFAGGDKVEVEEVPNVEKIAAKKDIATKTAELQAMEKGMEELTADIERFEVYNRNFFQVRNEYLKIERELSESTEQLKFWDDSLRRTQMALALSVGDRGLRLSFVQRAPELGKPSSPTLFKILAGALALGLAVGTLMIVLAELLDHSYRSVEQAIEEIKLPVLGAINEIVSPSAAMRRKIFGWGVFPAVTMGLLLVLGGVFFMTYLSLELPHKYDAFKANPVRFISQTFLGGA